MSCHLQGFTFLCLLRVMFSQFNDHILQCTIKKQLLTNFDKIRHLSFLSDPSQMVLSAARNKICKIWSWLQQVWLVQTAEGSHLQQSISGEYDWGRGVDSAGVDCYLSLNVSSLCQNLHRHVGQCIKDSHNLKNNMFSKFSNV